MLLLPQHRRPQLRTLRQRLLRKRPHRILQRLPRMPLSGRRSLSRNPRKSGFSDLYRVSNRKNRTSLRALRRRILRRSDGKVRTGSRLPEVWLQQQRWRQRHRKLWSADRTVSSVYRQHGNIFNFQYNSTFRFKFILIFLNIKFLIGVRNTIIQSRLTSNIYFFNPWESYRKFHLKSNNIWL